MINMLHPAPVNAVKYQTYISRTVIRDNGDFVSVDVYTRLVGGPNTISSEEFSHTRHFGGGRVPRIDAHTAALRWVLRGR